MPRPAGDADRRLLEAARGMIAETGLSDLRVRAVARRAGVNLGMFHYHFGTRDRFIRRLLDDIYEEFFSKFSLESKDGADPVERLRRALIVFGRFARDQRKVFATLVGETMKGNRHAADFLRTNMPRHAGVVAGLIAEGQRAGELKKLPMPVAMSFALGGMGAPNLACLMLERLGPKTPFGVGLEELKEMFLSDEAIELRSQLVIAGLKS
jgi:AcrR family transcriptional regulator